jgi:Glycosyltransferase family 87
MQTKNRLFLFFIPLLLVLGFCLKRSLSVPPSDFAGYYYGSRALLTGHYQQAYDMQALNDLIAAGGYRNVFVSYAPFPPFTSLVISPFLLFPMGPAKILFDLFSAALFCFTLLRTCRYFFIPLYMILLLPVIFFIPLLNNLAFGQSYLILFCLLLEGYIAYRKEQRILSSTLWAMAILFKLFPAFLFFFLILRKQYRSVFYLGLACILLLLPSLWLNGIPAWKFYISDIIPKMGRGELNDSFTYVFQSFFMLLKRIFLYDGLLNPHPFLNNPYLFTLGMALFKALILVPAALLTIRERDDFFSFSVWVTASMLISPNGSSYSLVLLGIPLLALTYSLLRADTLRTANTDVTLLAGGARTVIIAAILLLAAACAIQVSRFGSFPVWAQFPRLYLLLLFFTLLIITAKKDGSVKKDWKISWVASCAMLFFIFDIRGNLPADDTSSYVLAKEQHLCIDNYSVQANKLVYYYRDDSGEHLQPTDYPVHESTGEGVSLVDNQIWYKGKKLTDSPDRKEKATLINGEYIFYLSDKHRGVGFYTLRKLRPDGPIPAAQSPDTHSRTTSSPVPPLPDAAAVPVSSR